VHLVYVDTAWKKCVHVVYFCILFASVHKSTHKMSLCVDTPVQMASSTFAAPAVVVARTTYIAGANFEITVVFGVEKNSP